MTRVFIVAGVRLYREGLAEVMCRSDRIEVVGTAPDWETAAESVADVRPDIVILDLAIAGGVDAARAAVAAEPEIKFVAFGISESERDVIAYAEAGIAGYVTRSDSLDDLLVAFECVTRGETLCSPRIASTLLRRVATLASQLPPPEQIPRLTPRELEIAALVEEGLPNKLIAQRLNIELATVKNHVHSILEKMQVKGRAEAAARMRRVASVGGSHR